MITNLVHIIDDDPILCDALQLLLTEAGFDTQTYASAPAFLKQFESTGGRCIVSDVHMPEMTGMELLEKLKHLADAPPVILITGGHDVSQVQAKMAGAAAFHQKPFDPDDLIASVRRTPVTRETEAGSPAGAGEHSFDSPAVPSPLASTAGVL